MVLPVKTGEGSGRWCLPTAEEKGIAVKPFRGPNYSRNSERCKGEQIPCAWCGKPCGEPWTFAVRVIQGGAAFANRDAPPDDGPGEMGCFPVGPDCARKLRAAGVDVWKWEP